jgi:hypothetical protein
MQEAMKWKQNNDVKSDLPCLNKPVNTGLLFRSFELMTSNMRVKSSTDQLPNEIRGSHII